MLSQRRAIKVTNNILCFFKVAILGVLLVSFFVIADEIEKNDMADSLLQVQSKEHSETEEIVLDAIEIIGNVEKPGVIILPKRIEPEIGKVELNRSFKREVEEDVGEVFQPGKALHQIEELKSIKKAVEKNRE
jgi:hypothetical protein